MLNLHGEELWLTYSVDTLISLMDDMRNQGVKNSKIEEYYKNLIKHNECDVFIQCYSKFINQTSETSILPILISCIMSLRSVDECYMVFGCTISNNLPGRKNKIARSQGFRNYDEMKNYLDNNL